MWVITTQIRVDRTYRISQCCQIFYSFANALNDATRHDSQGTFKKTTSKSRLFLAGLCLLGVCLCL